MTDRWPRVGNNTDHAVLKEYRSMSPQKRRTIRASLITMYRLHRKGNKAAAGQYSRRIKLLNKVEKEVFNEST